MKPNRIIKIIAGFFLFVFVILASVWLFSPAPAPKVKEILLDEAISRINNKEIKAINISPAELILEDKSKNKFHTPLNESDEPREAVLKAANESQTQITFEPASSGQSWNWLILINLLPTILLAACLGVLIYIAVKLSRNKG